MLVLVLVLVLKTIVVLTLPNHDTLAQVHEKIVESVLFHDRDDNDQDFGRVAIRGVICSEISDSRDGLDADEV